MPARRAPTSAMRGAVQVTARRRGDATVVTVCAGSVPLAPRVVPAGRPSWAAVALVQTAAGPLAGDELDVDVDVGPGAALEIFGVAATIAMPAARAAVQRVRCSVGGAGRLWWRGAPLVLAAGCRLESLLDLELDAGAVALTEEAVVLGRTGEEPGAFHGILRCDLDGTPLLRDEIRVGGAHRSPAVLGAARAYGGLSLLGVRGDGPLQLAGPGTVARVVATDSAELAARLDAERGALAAALDDPYANLAPGRAERRTCAPRATHARRSAPR